MAKIKTIIAREILDSRAYPTVEAQVVLDDGATGTSSVPTGVSTGRFEAKIVLDKDKERFNGFGVLQAVANINALIGPKLVGKEASDQKEIDQLMINLDNTEDKNWLGANAILPVSQAVCKASAQSLDQPLYRYLASLFPSNKPFSMPSPQMLMLEGGKHGAGNLDFQEFMITSSAATKFSKALQRGAEIYYACEEILKHRGAVYLVGDEGGYAPNLLTNSEALEIIVSAVKQTPYQLGTEVFLSLDVAASHFKKNGRYSIKDQPTSLAPSEMIDYYKSLYLSYRLLSIEDPLGEEDWSDWKKLTEKLGENTLIVGDDLLVTNKKRLKKAIEQKACNAILVKPNQIGTITETLETVREAQKAGFKIIISHRGGETTDDFLADLAVAVRAEYTKFGAPARGERVVKYNRLLAIETELIESSQPPKES